MQKSLGSLLAMTTIGALLSGCGMTDPKPDANAIGNLCSTFSRSGHKAMLTPSMRNNIKSIERGGVPSNIKQTVEDYYNGQLLNGDQIQTLEDSRRRVLDDKKTNIMNACHNTGWHE